ncbi:MAG TPA: hypothetical protein VG841_15985 [Caulobacterales bacterium]|nr:hypothetical protein [Caulobacterales bacterium]
MRWTRRIVTLPPAVVTGGFVLLFVAADVLIDLAPLRGRAWSIAFWGSMFALIAPLMVWHYSLYREAMRARARSPGLALLFVGPLIAILAWTALPLSDAVWIVLIPTHLSYFVSIWCAARELVLYEAGAAERTWTKVLGTFLLEFYLPVGVWFLHPRIKRMIAASDQQRVVE